MASTHSPANKRTSTGIKTVPTNTGSRLTRFVGHLENALVIHPANALHTTATAIVKAPSKLGFVVEDVTMAAVGAVKWLNQNPDNVNKNKTPVEGYHRKRKDDPLKTRGGNNVITAASNPPVIPIQSDPDSTYSWNLPPHEWSLPVDPGSVSTTVSQPSDANALHSNRRGRIFLARKYNGTTSTTDAKTGKKANTVGNYNSNYGFQFLWNPETFTQNTSVNWGITPSQNDATAMLTGLVTANSTIDLTLRIDRTNDFAAAKSMYTKVTNAADEARNYMNITALAKYYAKGQAPGSSLDFANNMEAKITDLLKRGTEADLEFLYKTINGDGYKSTWGTTTSNISFLLPTIIRLDLGPQRLVGMIQSVNVSHLAFTREMIPIRTDVTLSIDLRTGTAFTSTNFGTDQTNWAGQ